MIRYDKEWFKRVFPNLAREVLEGGGITDPLRGFTPGPVDFIRRARSAREAEEVIDYLERVGEIGRDEAESLRRKLREGGLESFGSRKGPGYYFRYAAGVEE